MYLGNDKSFISTLKKSGKVAKQILSTCQGNWSLVTFLGSRDHSYREEAGRLCGNQIILNGEQLGIFPQLPPVLAVPA